MSKKITPYILLAPTVVIFILFIGYPIFSTVVRSVVSNDNTSLVLSNYLRVFRDRLFFLSISNSLIIAVFYLIMKIPVSIIISEMLNGITKGKKIVLILLFIPTTVGVFAYGIIFRILFSSDGLLNSIFNQFGFQVSFLDNPLLAKFVVSVALLISTMGSMVLYLLISRNNNINQSIEDSCIVDGVGFFSRMRYIVIPMLLPILKVFTLFGVIESIAVIDISYQLSGGGPNNGTLTLGYYIYKQAIVYGEFAYASTLSIITLILILIALVLFRKVRGTYNGQNY